MKTKMKIIGSMLIICTLIGIVSAGGEKRYNVSQLRGKWQMENRSPRSYKATGEYTSRIYTRISIMNGDTLIKAKYWFYLSDSVVTTFDWKQLDVRTSARSSGKYIVSQSSEDLMPSCKYSCSVYKILFLNQDSLVIQYVPKRGEVMIGGEPVAYKRISN